MKLIIGLGNPGEKYTLTRHNIGFIAMDYYAQQHHCDFKMEKKFNAMMCKTNINKQDVILIKPQTFMNLSGESVLQVMNYYKIKISDILVIHDDLDLEFNTVKLKFNSSSGGQNGIKNIIKHLGSQEFLRIKVGILNEFKKDTNQFVLSNFAKDEQKSLIPILNKINFIIDDFIRGDDKNTLMNKYN